MPKSESSGSSTPTEAGRLEFLERENEQLRHALSSRIVIEQAKGVLAERFQIDVEQAFELLRRAARSHRMPIRVLATAVMTAGVTPPEIEGALLGVVPPDGTAAPPSRAVETS